MGGRTVSEKLKRKKKIYKNNDNPYFCGWVEMGSLLLGPKHSNNIHSIHVHAHFKVLFAQGEA